jgi:hypothetical protein
VALTFPFATHVGMPGASTSAYPYRTFPFDQTLEALAYVEQDRANGKVVITLD